MNKPFQVYLNDRQRQALDRLAIHLGRSRADLVRLGIDRIIRELAPVEEDSAWHLLGLADSPDMPSDLAERHDEYLTIDHEKSREG